MGEKIQYGIISLKCFVWKISKSIFSSTFFCQINHQVQAKERYILRSLSSTFFPFVLTNILHFFWITLDSQSTFFKKICTLAPSMSTFILMLIRNCQSGITRFFVNKCGDWWNSDLIKSVPMLSLTSTELEFQPWHFSHFQCINPCFYHWFLLMSLTVLFFCFLPTHGLCASSVFRVLLECWRHHNRWTYRMSLWLESSPE